MTVAPTVLAAARTTLGELPGLTGEWSLRLTGGRATVRPHVVLWVGARSRRQESFARLQRLLRDAGAHADLRDRQVELAPVSVRQGVGVVGPDVVSLYVQRTGPTGTDDYLAFKEVGASVATTSYTFTRFTDRSAADAVRSSVHPTQRSLYAALLRDARLVARSGFWTRTYAGAVDKICLTYPWLPPVSGVDGLGTGVRSGSGLAPFRTMHLRHVSLAGVGARTPVVTLYFSGRLRAGTWPIGAAQFRRRVEESAARTSRAINGPSDNGPEPATAVIGCPAGTARR